MNNLIEFNENLDTPIYRPSILEDLQQKHQYFEVPDIDSQINRQNNPHYWYNKIYYKLHNFRTYSSKITHLMMTLYHKFKSLQDSF